MGYLKITNLYRRPEYLKLFKTVYVAEKLHGTSQHVAFKDGKVTLFSGGIDHLQFTTLFNKEKLLEIYNGGTLAGKEVTIYGEGIGGSCQKMSHVYGKNISFIPFEVNIDDKWLEMPDAEEIVKRFGFKFIWYKEVENTLDNLNQYRDQPSQFGLAEGHGEHIAEGIVTRPIYECYDKRGGRWILKHKRDDFAEVKTPREVDPNKAMNVLRGQTVADEFVTEMRLRHILDKNPYTTLQDVPKVIQLMVEDIASECEGEYISSKIVIKAIGGKTVVLFKKYLQDKLLEN